MINRILSVNDARTACRVSGLLRHVNPYTGLALKDDPAIPFIEMINEPVHQPEDIRGLVDYNARFTPWALASRPGS
jgi:hypothetical protein